MRVFLGGTCAETYWRDELMPLLDSIKVSYFNPVVKDWTPECQKIEEEEKNDKCDIHLYVITKEIQGTYSIAEIIHSAHLANIYGTKVSHMLFFVLDKTGQDWNEDNKKSFKATMRLVHDIAPHNSTCKFVSNMEEVAKEIANLSNH